MLLSNKIGRLLLTLDLSSALNTVIILWDFHSESATPLLSDKDV